MLVKIAAICFITAMKRISMQSFNNNVNVQFVPQVMLKQVADNCSVGETSSFNDCIIAIMETQLIQRVVCLHVHVKFVQSLKIHYTCTSNFTTLNFRFTTWKIRYFEFCYCEKSTKFANFSGRIQRNLSRKFVDFST